MTAAYKKRAKGGWNSDKEVANRKERIHAQRLEKDASIEDSAFVEDLAIRSECNHELNMYLSGIEIEEEPNTNKPKKKQSHKDVIRLLSNLRYIYKFAQNHAGGSVENLRLQDRRSDWWNKIRQERYQQYRKLLPEVQKLLEREDLPNKIMRQVKEVLALFNIETTTKQD